MNRKERRAAAARETAGRAGGATAADGAPRAGETPGLADIVRLHQAGCVAEAADLYRLFLLRDPDNADALNLLGVACLQQGEAGEALERLNRAAALRPLSAEIVDNLGSALRAAGHPAEAVLAHRRAAGLAPAMERAHYNLGNALAETGAHRLAADAFRQAVTLRPGYAAAHFNLGNSLKALGDLPAAAAEYRAALAASPGFAEAWNNLADTLVRLGDEAGAEAAYRRSLEARPDHAQTLCNLGNLLKDRNRPRDAEACLRRAVAVDPGHAEARLFLGVALQAQDRVGEAVEAYRAGLAIEPDNVLGLINLGAGLELAGQLPEAASALRRALALDPDNAEAHGNLGLCLMDLGRLDEAAAHLDRAAALAPDLAQPRMARGMLRLRRGDLSGWVDYGWRFAAGEALPDRRFSVPRWQGEPVPDARLLLWREQGLGDELMFATAYRDAMARAGRTVIECDPRLVGLFRRSFPTAEVRAEPPPGLAGREESPDADLETPAGSLGRWLRRSLASFDGAPYLKPDPARVAVWAERLAALGPGLTVGVCWRSRLMTARRRPAYADFTDWLPLLRLPGVRVVNLQYDAGEEELRGLEERHGVTLARWSGLDLTDDLEEVAALVSGLDLVVAAPTAVGELAGALGVPVWRVSGPTDWSMLGAGARPWFASMRVLAPGPGEPLGPVLARAARDLQSLA